MTEAEREWLLEQRRWRTEPQGLLRWAVALQLRNEKGDLLEWRDRRFLIEILCDLHPLQVTVKCSQVGLSTVNILKSAFMAQVMGYGIIYTLPTDSLLEEFASTKVDLIYRQNAIIRPTEGDSQGKRVYDPGYILYRGTFGQRQQISITADLIISDETDRSNLAVVEGLNSRLDASAYKGRWRFTNPTRPNVGTDLTWQESDQRRWHVTCPACNTKQTLDWWQNVDREREVYCCRRCRAELSDDDRRNGRWLVTKPGARWHGYHLNQLMAPWISASFLLQMEKEESQEQFFNFRLGLPVVGGGLSADPDVIRRAQVWPVPDDLQPKQRFMGVDVGAGLHVMMGDEYGTTKLAYLTDQAGASRWQQLEDLIKQGGINLCVIDNAPAEDQAKLQEACGRHRVLRCVYDYDDKRKETWEVDRGRGILNAHRTRTIDETLDAFATGGLAVYLDKKEPLFDGTGKPGMENCLTKHWGTLYVIGADGQDVNLVKKDRMGNVIRTWENAGPDHFAHATVYYYLARQVGRHVGTDRSGVVPGLVHHRPKPEEDDDDDRPRVRWRGM